MKRFTLVILMILVVVLLSRFTLAGELTPAQVKGEILFQTLNIADGALTIKGLKQEGVEEVNPILGTNPSDGTVLLFIGAVGITHYIFTRYIYQTEKNRKIWLWGTNIIKAAVVGHNITVIEW